MMRRTTMAWAVGTVLGALALGGCRAGPIDLFKEVFGPSREKLAGKAFRDKDADVRREYIVLVSNRYWGLDKNILPGYAAVAADRTEDVSVRGVALRALGRAGKDAAVHTKSILEALNARSENVRWDAAVALDRVHHPVLVEPLSRRATKDRSGDVRQACAKALRHYRRTEVAAALVDCMEDRDYGVIRRAHVSLVEMVGQDLGDEAADWETVRTALPPRPKRRPWWDILGLTAVTPGEPSMPDLTFDGQIHVAAQ